MFNTSTELYVFMCHILVLTALLCIWFKCRIQELEPIEKPVIPERVPYRFVYKDELGRKYDNCTSYDYLHKDNVLDITLDWDTRVVINTKNLNAFSFKKVDICPAS